MKAIIQRTYGSPDVLKFEDIAKPTVQDNELLIKVHATAVHAGDCLLMRGTPFLTRLIYGGIFKPKVQILGCDVAGCVEAVGQDITQFKVGDEVFGDLSEYGFGAFAEYVCVPAEAVILKPAQLSFTEAATLPVSALAALQGLRDVGQIQAGQKVLINGASGGVGGFAVQIAKSLGAEVTGVCRSEKVERVRSLGADHVLDYTKVNFTENGAEYDLIFDAAAYRSVLVSQRALTATGTYVLVGGSTAHLFQTLLFLGPWISRTSRRKIRVLVSKPNQADLLALRALLESGAIAPRIDRSYSLREVPEAIRYLEARRVQGKVSITVA
jgi:NADPH:quinone reductase-like Zn-dependent oxidoreductase